MITFVGAGPGAVDLITVRGLRLIQEADVVIYAGSLVNPELLKEVKESCKVYDSSGMTLPELVDVMAEAEKQKLKVVRLHTGDPSLYGAIREQLDALRQGVYGSGSDTDCDYIQGGGKNSCTGVGIAACSCPPWGFNGTVPLRRAGGAGTAGAPYRGICAGDSCGGSI